MDESLLPGCYGSPVMCPAQYHCRRCSHLAECQVAAKSRAERIQTRGKVEFRMLDKRGDPLASAA